MEPWTSTRLADADERRAEPAPRSILDVNPIRTAYRINYVANFYTGPIYKQVEQRWGLSRPDFIVMFCLSLQPGLLARDIVAICGRPKNSISRAVAGLTARGLVVADATRAVARGLPLRLSPDGERVTAEILPLFQEREASMLAPFTAEERETFDRLLAKLAIRDDGWDAGY